MRHLYSVERLIHYQCGKCSAWWSIGDGPTDEELTCVKCGHKAACLEGESDEHINEMARAAGYIQ